jgi:hypothetical protein
MERPVNPPEQDDFCEDCGRHIGTGIRCRTCLLDGARLEHYEED